MGRGRFHHQQEFRGNLNSSMPDGRPAQFHEYHLQNMLWMKPAVRQLIAELTSGPSTLILERLTGIPKLLTDPLLQGGGVHLEEPGGLLRVHADLNRHAALHIERRLNLLFCLNQDWKEEYGGRLELWDRQMIALYYYTVDRLERGGTPGHGALWQELPEEREGK